MGTDKQNRFMLLQKM